MALTDIMAMVQALLQGALGASALDPIPTVLTAIPRALPDPVNIYCYHDGSTDMLKDGGPQILRRHHIIPIHVLVITGPGDDQQSERTLWALHDVITGAFYTNRRLNGLVATSTLRQRDGENGVGPAFLEHQGKEWRQRWWSLDAEEQITQVMH